MLYTVTNNGRSRQIVTNVEGRDIVLAPDTSRKIDLSEKSADRLRRSPALKLVPAEAAVEKFEDTDTSTEADTSTEVNASTEVDTDTSNTSNEKSSLVARYESKEINFGEFQAEAKKLLGDTWPGGTPRKTDIIKLLRA